MTDTTTAVEPGSSNGHANGNGAAEAKAPAAPAPKALPKASKRLEARLNAAAKAGEAAAIAATGANPLKALEKKVGKVVTPAKAKPVAPAKGKAATAKAPAKAAAKSDIPAKPKFTYTRRFARVFELMLAAHGYELTVSKDEKLVIAENKTAAVRVEIINPNKQWASKTCPWKATRKGKPLSGEGRDALAKELGVPGYGRR